MELYLQDTRLMKKNSCQFYARAEGCKVWDLDGKEYIDLLCGYGPNILGYGDQVRNIKVKNKSKWMDAPTMKHKSSTKKNTCRWLSWPWRSRGC